MGEDHPETGIPDNPSTGGRALVLPGRDLVTVAARATAGERFSRADIELMLAGVRPNTRLALRAAWKKVLRFTGEQGYDECPMPVATCVKLIDWCWTQVGRYGRPTSPESVKQMLWAVTKAHKVAIRPDGTRGYVSPVSSEEVHRALAGYTTRYILAGHRPDIASPITPDEAAAMVRTCDVRSPIGLRDALALALIFDGGFRAGEVVMVDAGEGSGRGILFEDVEVRTAVADPASWSTPAELALDPDDHLIVHVPMSKTDVEGYGDEVYLYAHRPEYAFNCPLRLFLAWRTLLRERGLELRGPVLRQVLHGMRAPADGRPKKGTVVADGLTYQGLVRLYGQAVSAAGLVDPQERRRHFVLHGLRAGSAEAAAERGADTPELNRHYRWSQRGTTAQRYAARGRKRRQNPARRIWADAGEADSR